MNRQPRATNVVIQNLNVVAAVVLLITKICILTITSQREQYCWRCSYRTNLVLL